VSPTPGTAVSPSSALAPWGDAWHAAGAPTGTLAQTGAADSPQPPPYPPAVPDPPKRQQPDTGQRLYWGLRP